MRFLTAGETHGKCLTAVLEGFPSGVTIDIKRVNNELTRRQQGYGRGERMKIEKDSVTILSGVRGGVSTGAPIALEIKNKDYKNWQDAMDTMSGDRSLRSLTNVRPGHADLSGVLKYGFPDARFVLERASARETAIRVAVGAICRELLYALNIEIGSHVTCIGGIKTRLRCANASLTRQADSNVVRCLDSQVASLMVQAIDLAGQGGDTLGGEVEVVATGVKCGFGSYVHFDRKLDYRIMGAIGSIQATKAVAIGDGFEVANLPGSMAHDEIFVREGKMVRATNHAGGIEGGMSNGESIVVRAVMKPIPSLTKGLNTINIADRTASKAEAERSDVCAVPAFSVVCENVLAFEIANAILETLGGDYLQEVQTRYNAK